MLSDRPLLEQVTLVALLPCVAGSVNAAGFLEVQTLTSHMTGIVTHAGETVAYGQWRAAAIGCLLVALFCVGAMSATMLVDGGRKRGRGHYAAALGLEALALGLFGVLSSHVAWREKVGHTILIGLLCFAMGLQNALVTRISGAIVRTTHLTGVVTDIGIELVRVVKQIRVSRGRITTLSESLRNDPEARKLKYHVTIFFSFFMGCVAGPLLFLRFGYGWLSLPLLLLLLLALLDITRGLGTKAA